MSELVGNWNKLASLLNPAKIRNSLTSAAARVGNLGASEIKRGIVSGEPAGQKFAPLHPVTIINKGSSKPLINHGDLLGSITYQVIDNNHVFIGVKKGKEANIARVHEYGCTIRVTHKMRAYLHYIGIHLRADTQFINIPSRPFIRPIVQSSDFKNRIAEIYLNAIMGMFT